MAAIASVCNFIAVVLTFIAIGDNFSARHAGNRFHPVSPVP